MLIKVVEPCSIAGLFLCSEKKIKKKCKKVLRFQILVIYLCNNKGKQLLFFQLLIFNIMSNATNKTALDRVKAHYKQELFEYHTGSSFFCKEDHSNRLSAIKEVLTYCFSLEREDIIQLKKEVAQRIERLKK